MPKSNKTSRRQVDRTSDRKNASVITDRRVKDSPTTRRLRWLSANLRSFAHTFFECFLLGFTIQTTHLVNTTTSIAEYVMTQNNLLHTIAIEFTAVHAAAMTFDYLSNPGAEIHSTQVSITRNIYALGLSFALLTIMFTSLSNRQVHKAHGMIQLPTPLRTIYTFSSISIFRSMMLFFAGLSVWLWYEAGIFDKSGELKGLVNVTGVLILWVSFTVTVVCTIWLC